MVFWAVKRLKGKEIDEDWFKKKERRKLKYYCQRYLIISELTMQNEGTLNINSYL